MAEPAWHREVRDGCRLACRDRGSLDADDADEMARRLTRARVVEIPDAAHDLHLDRPDEWRRELTGFWTPSP